uniref:Uncharacterized protein n=1 Tax=Tetradesmus obliquus TaxID=3088 RepID=A0A383WM66_TETOB|eukprot:jgi/Sobl393_1/14408/SZX69370.1
MQAYVDAPVVEVHEDQQVDLSLAQLQQDLQEQLQQHQRSSAEQPAAADSDNLAASMHSSTTQGATEAPAGEAVAAADEPAAAVEAAPAASLAHSSKPASCEDESEWHLVSPNGSVRLRGAGSSSSRGSFDYSGVSPRIGSDAGSSAADNAAQLMAAADESGSDSEASHTPKDALAASILGHSVLMGRSASCFGSDNADVAAATAAADEMHAASDSDDGMEALREASMVSGEGGLDGLAAADDDAASAAVTAAAAAGASGGAAAVEAEVLTGLGLLGGEVAQLVGAAQGGAAGALAGLREWLLESLAALVQGGRVSHAAACSTRDQLQRSLHLMAKQGGLAAAAVGAAADWRVVLSSAAALVCLAMWMRSRNEAASLRASLRRRDHELSKLVMRLVSLQELLNQGQGLPLNRYMRYEGVASVAAASYM